MSIIPYDITPNNGQWDVRKGYPIRHNGSLYVRLTSQNVSATFGAAGRRGFVSVWKSTDEGVTWAQKNGEQGNQVLYDGNSSYSQYFTPIPGVGVVRGDIIYLAYYRQISGTRFDGYLSILRFDMSTDTWLSPWETSSPIIDTYCRTPSVAFDSIGNGIVCYDAATPALGPTYIKICSATISSSGVWGAEVVLSAYQQYQSNSFTYSEVIYDEDDVSHVFYSTSAGVTKLYTIVSEYLGQNILGIIPTSLTYGPVLTGRPRLLSTPVGQQIVIPYHDVSLAVPLTAVATKPISSGSWAYIPSATGPNTYHKLTLCEIGNTLFTRAVLGPTNGVFTPRNLTQSTWSAAGTAYTVFGNITSSEGSPTMAGVGNSVIGHTVMRLPTGLDPWDVRPAYFTETIIQPADPLPCPACPECPDNSVPAECDPPFPPVYPYLFSTDTIYGRDHLSLNIKMVRGDTYVFDAAITLNGAAVDLTGGLVRMTAKWAVANADAAAVFALTSVASAGVVITNAALGEVRITISPSHTNTLPSKKVELPYDIQFVNSIGSVFTVLYGTLTIVPDVTIAVV